MKKIAIEAFNKEQFDAINALARKAGMKRYKKWEYGGIFYSPLRNEHGANYNWWGFSPYYRDDLEIEGYTFLTTQKQIHDFFDNWKRESELCPECGGKLDYECKHVCKDNFRILNSIVSPLIEFLIRYKKQYPDNK